MTENDGSGWFNHPTEHSLASQGVKTKKEVNHIDLDERKNNYKNQIQKQIEEKKQNMNIDEEIETKIEVIIDSPSPLEDSGIFGQAHPHSDPPTIELEIYPLETSQEEIDRVITDELLHIKRPDLKQYSEKKFQETDEWKELYQKYLN